MFFIYYSQTSVKLHYMRLSKILFKETVSSNIMPLTDVSDGTETSFLTCSATSIFPSTLSCPTQAYMVNKLLNKTRTSFTFIDIIQITFDVKNHPMFPTRSQLIKEFPFIQIFRNNRLYQKKLPGIECTILFIIYTWDSKTKILLLSLLFLYQSFPFQDKKMFSYTSF